MSEPLVESKTANPCVNRLLVIEIDVVVVAPGAKKIEALAPPHI